MTVKELIKILKTFPPNTEVVVPAPEYWEGDRELSEPNPSYNENAGVLELL